jgi:tRNA pseudouridine38-40 synthase
MPVVRLDLAYDGTGFHGWARQPGVRTIQGEVEAALGRVLGEPPMLSVAGRTDAGVHAQGQVASFVTDGPVDVAQLHRALNGLLGPEIAVLGVRRVPPGFDARRSAAARIYRYRVRVAGPPDPFEARFVWHRPGPLAIGRMRRAARHLVGEHDFASFCRTPPPGSGTVRSLRRLTVAGAGDELHVVAEANAFCHQMVRSLVGTLVRVGAGGLDPESVPDVLVARTRSAAGPVAPPQGLTLVRVRYARSGPGR